MQLKAKNSTSQGWHFALYQKQPKEMGLKDMYWKVLSLSKPQPNPTTGIIPWTLNFEVTIPQKQESDIYYVGGVSMSAKEGYKYEAVMEQGYIQIKEVGHGNPGYIHFKNSTHAPQALGLSMGGSLLAMQKEVAGGVTAQFEITPTYYLGLFTNVQEGAFVSSDAAVGPVTIKFLQGMTTASVEAKIEDQQDVLSAPTYS